MTFTTGGFDDTETAAEEAAAPKLATRSKADAPLAPLLDSAAPCCPRPSLDADLVMRLPLVACMVRQYL